MQINKINVRRSVSHRFALRFLISLFWKTVQTAFVKVVVWLLSRRRRFLVWSLLFVASRFIHECVLLVFVPIIITLLRCVRTPATRSPSLCILFERLPTPSCLRVYSARWLCQWELVEKTGRANWQPGRVTHPVSPSGPTATTTTTTALNSTRQATVC